MKENMQTVWVGELERLGYHMIVVGRTEKEAREALLEAYDKTYRDLNDTAKHRRKKETPVKLKILLMALKFL